MQTKIFFLQNVCKTTHQRLIPDQEENIINQIYILKNEIFTLDTKPTCIMDFCSSYSKVAEKLATFHNELLSLSLNEITLNKIHQIISIIRTKEISKLFLFPIIDSLLCNHNISLISTLLSNQIELINNNTYENLILFSLYHHTLQYYYPLFQLLPIEQSVAYLTNNLTKIGRLFNLIIIEFSNTNSSTNNSKQHLETFMLENLNNMIRLNKMNIDIFKEHVFESCINILWDKNLQVYSEFILQWIINEIKENYIIEILPKLFIEIEKLVHIDKQILNKIQLLFEKILTYYNSSIRQEQRIEIQNKINEFIVGNNDIVRKICLNNELILSINFADYMECLYKIVKFYLIFTLNTKYFDDSLKYLKQILNCIFIYIDHNKDVIIDSHAKRYFDLIKEVLFNNKLPLLSFDEMFRFAEYMDNDMRKEEFNSFLTYCIHGNDKFNSIKKVKNIIKFLLYSYDKNEIEQYNANISEVLCKIEAYDPFIYLNMIKEIKTLFEYDKDNESESEDNENFENKIIQRGIKLYLKTLTDFLPKLENEIDENEKIYNEIVEKEISDEICGEEEFIDLTNMKYDDTEEDKQQQIKFEYSNNGNKKNMFILSNYNFIKMKSLYTDYFSFLQETVSSSFQEYQLCVLITIKNILRELDSIRYFRKCIEKYIANIYSTYINLLGSDIEDDDMKRNCFSEIVYVLSQSTILSKKSFLFVIKEVTNYIKFLQKRTETTKAILDSCDLYYNVNLLDKKKVETLINDAIKEAEFAMINPENLDLFIIILNKMLFYSKDKNNFIKLEKIQTYLNYVKDHLPEVKKINEELGKKIENDYYEIIFKLSQQNK